MRDSIHSPHIGNAQDHLIFVVMSQCMFVGVFPPQLVGAQPAIPNPTYAPPLEAGKAK